MMCAIEYRSISGNSRARASRFGRNGFASGFVVAAVAAGAASQAWAASISVSLPDPTYSGQALNQANVSLWSGGSSHPVSIQPVSGPGHISNSASVSSVLGLATSQSSIGTIDVKTGPNPSLSATITNSSLLVPPDYMYAVAGGQDYAELDYSLEIAGPNGSVPILVSASGGYSASFGPGSYFYDHGASASFSVSGVVNDHVGFDFDSGNPAPPYTFSDVNTYTMLTNRVYAVSLAVNVSGTITETFGGGTETISAYIDPTFAIGDGVADPRLYSIEVSPGIGNSAGGAVPEPSTWAMILLGFAGLGWAGYRRRVAARMTGTPV